MDIHYLVEEGGLYHYQLKIIGGVKQHSFEFELRRISSWEVDEANTPIIDDEVSAAGFVKWDGCANIMFDGGGYAHFCGVNDIRRHGLALIEVYRVAYEYFLGAPSPWYAKQNPDSFIIEG